MTNALQELKQKRLYIKGEQIPEQRFADLFCLPPGIPIKFSRNSLILGSMGAGKSTILRYVKETHDGIAVYVNFVENLKWIPLSVCGEFEDELPKMDEDAISKKVSSHLSICFAKRLALKGVSIPANLIRNCLPSSVPLPKYPELSIDQLTELELVLAREPMDKFQELNVSVLPAFLNAIGESISATGKSLLLALDRVDQVAWPAIIPAFEILDQSSSYTILVAMRPGHAGELIQRSVLLRPGDNYAIRHLGRYPYSEAWRAFLRKALIAQIGEEAFSSISQEKQSLILTLARDSVGIALAAFDIARSYPGDLATNVVDALVELRDTFIKGMESSAKLGLRGFHDLLGSFRKKVLNSQRKICRVVLELRTDKPDLFGEDSSYRKPIDLALKVGAFCTCESHPWYPGSYPPKLLEIPLLYLFQKDDSSSPIAENEEYRVTIEMGQLFHPPMMPKIKQLFISYQLKDNASREFKTYIEGVIQSNPIFKNFCVVDGTLLPGQNLSEILKRIKNSDKFVADITAGRPEIMIELGAAFQLNIPFVTAVKGKSFEPELPRWLQKLAIHGSYENTDHMNTLCNTLATLGQKRKRAKSYPIPGYFVWLRNPPWAETTRKSTIGRLTHVEKSDRVIVHKFIDDQADWEDWVEYGTKATLLVVCLNGDELDSLVYFICGAFLVQPTSGSGKNPMKRSLLVLENPTLHRAIATYTLQNSPRVKIININEIGAEIDSFLQKTKKEEKRA